MTDPYPGGPSTTPGDPNQGASAEGVVAGSANPPSTAGPVDTSSSKGSADGRSSYRWLIEWGAVVLVALLLAGLGRVFVAQTYFIPSGSMEPTLQIGDRIVVDKLSYELHSVRRGDIVVFSRPPREVNPEYADLVKRVIGLPGDTISSEPNGIVLINGKPLNEPYLTASARTNPGIPIPTQVVPTGEYFVMGDNRGFSEDSRYFGPIEGNTIVGRAVVIFWPTKHLHWL